MAIQTASPSAAAADGLAVWIATSAGLVYRNSVAIVNNGAAFAAITATTIGRRGDGFFPYDDEVREVLYYPTAHDAPTQAAELTKAAARCGVTL